MACKYVLGVQKQTSNVAVLLELGRVPIGLFAIKAAIKNWERIKSNKVTSLVHNSYSKAMEANLLWVSRVKLFLDQNGMASFYTNNYQDKHPFIHKKLFQRLSDNFHQEAFSTITNQNSKLRTYGILKDEIGMEKYLSEIYNPVIRKGYTKFRLSNHNLNIEKGRHKNIPKELRFCPFCPNQVETEVHFLIECETYKTVKEATIQPIMDTVPNFAYYTKTEQFQYLLREELAPITAQYINNCFELRNFLVEKPKRCY